MESDCQKDMVNLIGENIHNLVKVQTKANACLKIFQDTGEDYTGTVEELKQCLLDEKELLSTIESNLNKLFDCGRFNKFRITKDSCSLIRDRYIIRLPLFLDKSSCKYQLLKPLMIDLHKHYFLMDGGIGYQFSNVESHMWEIPCFIKDNELIAKLRKRI